MLCESEGRSSQEKKNTASAVCWNAFKWNLIEKYSQAGQPVWADSDEADSISGISDPQGWSAIKRPLHPIALTNSDEQTTGQTVPETRQPMVSVTWWNDASRQADCVVALTLRGFWLISVNYLHPPATIPYNSVDICTTACLTVQNSVASGGLGLFEGKGRQKKYKGNPVHAVGNHRNGLLSRM